MTFPNKKLHIHPIVMCNDFLIDDQTISVKLFQLFGQWFFTLVVPDVSESHVNQNIVFVDNETLHNRDSGCATDGVLNRRSNSQPAEVC